MKQDIKDKWVKALRSGEYKQTTNRLFDGEAYCCLGVLCKVTGYGFVKKSSTDGYYQYSCRGHYVDLPKQVMSKSGMDSHSGQLFVDGMEDSLMTMNDYGLTFDQIADVIEKNWEKL